MKEEVYEQTETWKEGGSEQKKVVTQVFQGVS